MTKCDIGYPECHCNDCIDAITEFKGLVKNAVYLLDGRPVFVVGFCPLESCAEVFYNNNHLDAPDSCQHGKRYDWVSRASDLKSIAV
jgi:hypothetical protein